MKYNIEYYKNHFPDKFLKLLEYRYPKIDKNKRRKHFLDEYSEKFVDGVDSQINQWCSAAQRDRVPTLEQLMNICELLDCDIDYFLTEQKVFQRDAQSASNYLGLEYETVERISNYSDKIKGLIDVIVFDNHNNNLNEDMKNSDLLFDLLDSIHNYAINYNTSSIRYKTINGGECEIADRKQIDSLLRSSSLRECETILNTVYIEYFETRNYYDWFYMNNMILEMVELGRDEYELRKKFPVPKHYEKTIPVHL